MKGAVGAAGGVDAALGASLDAAAAGASSACAKGVHARNNPKMRLSLIFDATPLNGAGVPLARSDAYHVRERENEYFAIAHLAGARRFLDHFDDLVHQGIGHGDFDLGFRHELDDVLSPSVHLGVTALPSEPTHLGHRHAVYADFVDRFANLVQLEGFDDGADQLHR